MSYFIILNVDFLEKIIIIIFIRIMESFEVLKRF